MCPCKVLREATIEILCLVRWPYRCKLFGRVAMLVLVVWSRPHPLEECYDVALVQQSLSPAAAALARQLGGALHLQRARKPP